MTPKKRSALLFLLLPSLVACSSSKKEAVESPGAPLRKTAAPYQALAHERFGSNAEFVFNKKKTHVLCLRRSKSDQELDVALQFFVYDLARDRIVWQDSHPNGKVRWIAPDKLQVVVMPGIVPGGQGKSETTGYIYDLSEERKIDRISPDMKK